MDKATFDRMHAEDQMANDKLKEGIEGFTKAIVDLEKQLAAKLKPRTSSRAVEFGGRCS